MWEVPTTESCSFYYAGALESLGRGYRSLRGLGVSYIENTLGFRAWGYPQRERSSYRSLTSYHAVSLDRLVRGHWSLGGLGRS